MSMLTPPGMGGKYRITGNAYPRMRRPHRRRRLVLALVAGVVALGLAGWGTLQLIDVFSGGGKGGITTAGGTAECKPSARPAAQLKNLPAPGRITVNVFNATPRGGLAKETADELKKRGFKVGEVGNAPKAYDKKVKGTAILLGQPAAAESTFPVLSTQIAGDATEHDARRGQDVDLILGYGFKELTPPKEAAAALTALSAPTQDAAKGKC